MLFGNGWHLQSLDVLSTPDLHFWTPSQHRSVGDLSHSNVAKRPRVALGARRNQQIQPVAWRCFWTAGKSPQASRGGFNRSTKIGPSTSRQRPATTNCPVEL